MTEVRVSAHELAVAGNEAAAMWLVRDSCYKAGFDDSREWFVLRDFATGDLIVSDKQVTVND